MGRKVGIAESDIVDVAVQLADRHGLAEVTLAAVAAELGVRSPSLYHHVAGLRGLRRLLALRAAEEMEGELRKAAADRAGAEALAAMASSLRDFILTRPGLYWSLVPAPTFDEDPELATAMARSVDVVASQLRRIGLTDDELVDAARALRAAVHGFTTLEMEGGFGLPDATDQSFHRLVDVVIAGFRPAS